MPETFDIEYNSDLQNRPESVSIHLLRLLLHGDQVTFYGTSIGKYKPDSDISSEIEIVLKWMTDNGISVKNPSEVRRYLCDHSDMTLRLPVFAKSVLNSFGVEFQKSLELYRSMESNDEHLVIYVRTSNYPEDMLDRIHAIVKEREEDLCKLSGWLLITTDFQPPK